METEERCLLLGIEAQPPSPSTRAHDTTDQWREMIRALIAGSSIHAFKPLAAPRHAAPRHDPTLFYELTRCCFACAVAAPA